MRIEKKKIDELIPASYNPRKDLQKNDKEYQKLKRSIQEFGYVDSVIWNERTGVVVGGHQRLKVLKDLGYEEIDVSVVDLDVQKEKALNIALNKISGDWDKKILKDLLQELDTGEFDIELTGFDDDELEKLLADDTKPVDEPEFEFTEELLEEHNYIVLYFDNQLDWQVAKEKFGIKSVHALDSREGYERKGIGRVIRGAYVLEKMK